MSHTSKKSISKAEYHQLHGLAIIAKRHWDALKEIDQAARSITGEQGDMGHTYDMMGQSRDVDDGLKILGIKVEP